MPGIGISIYFLSAAREHFPAGGDADPSPRDRST
jgi:hypothetical protein